MSWIRRVQEFLTVESTEASQDRLVRLAATVDKGLRSYIEAGKALREIRDRQLFKMVASTFDEFCQSRWKMTPQHASRLINAAEVAEDVEPTGSRPPTERQARPLAALPREERAEAYREAIEEAGGEPRTEHIEAAVERRRPSSKKAKAPKPLRLRVPGGVVTIEPGRGFTSYEDAIANALAQLAKRQAA